jgi:hypothetical protein
MVVTTRGTEPGSPHKRPSGAARPEPGRSRPRGGLPDPAALDVRAALLDLRATTPRHRLTAVWLRTAATAIRVVTVARSPIVLGWPPRKGLILGLAVVAAGLGAVVVSTAGRPSGPPEFRPPPGAVTQPSAAGPSAAAGKAVLAPYARSSAAGPRLAPGLPAAARDSRNGTAAPEPSATARRGRVLPGMSARPANRPPARTGTRAVTGARGGLPEKAASISIGEPGDGATVSGAVTVSGTADLPEGHQVWLLWQQGPSGSHHVGGACRGGRTFVCGSVSLAGGGDDTFLFTAVVVDPSTAAALTAGATRESLPGHVTRSEVTVRRTAG